MKKILFLFLLIFPGTLVYTQQENKKVILVPFDYKQDSVNPAMAQSVSEMLFYSFYNYLSIFTFLEIPDESELSSIRVQEKDLLNTAREQKADFIVYGEFSLNGNSSLPEVIIHVKVWSLAQRALIMDKLIRSPLDLDIFDSIDKLAADTLMLAFQVRSGFSSITFSIDPIGREQYELFINNKKKTVLSNQHNIFQQKILGDNSYKVVLKLIDGGIVYKEKLSIAPGSITNIRYIPRANLNVDSLRHFKKSIHYQVRLDDTLLRSSAFFKNIPAGINYTLSVKTNGLIISNQTFYLGDRQVISVRPSAGYYPRWYFSIGLGGKSGTLEVKNTISLSNYFSQRGAFSLLLRGEYNLTPRLNLSAGLGMTIYNNTTYSNLSVNLWDLLLEARFQVFGDWKKDTRLYVGLFTEFHFYSLKNQSGSGILSRNALIPEIDPGLALEAHFRSDWYVRIQWYLDKERIHDLSYLEVPAQLINPSFPVKILAGYKIAF